MSFHLTRHRFLDHLLSLHEIQRAFSPRSQDVHKGLEFRGLGLHQLHRGATKVCDGVTRLTVQGLGTKFLPSRLTQVPPTPPAPTHKNKNAHRQVNMTCVWAAECSGHGFDFG